MTSVLPQGQQSPNRYQANFAQNYAQQGEDYRNLYSQDQFKGQRQNYERDQAHTAEKKRLGVDSLTDEQSKAVRENTPIFHIGHTTRDEARYYKKGDDGTRSYAQITDDDNPFSVTDLKDFDLAAYGVGSQKGIEKLNEHDVRSLNRLGGYSFEDLNKYASDVGEDRVGIGARKLLDKKMAELQGNPPAGGTTPEAEAFKNSKVQQVKQDQSFDRQFGDNQNTIGDENKIYGNVNQGNQDFSVNIGSQGAGQGRGSGSNLHYLSNMQSAAAYNALNENQWERSQAKFNPYAKAQGNIDATKDSTKVSESNRASNEMYGGLRDLYRSQTTDYMTNLFGDYFNKEDYKPPRWNAPAAPSTIDPDYG